MNNRVSKIVSQVRLYLNQISTDALKDKEIYNKANYIQDEILRETKCNEIEFTIYTKSDVEEYDLNVENQNMIKLIETGWGSRLLYISPTGWDGITITGGGYPAYYTLFDKKLRLRVNPRRDDDEIKIWAYQESVNIAMDNDIEPETPKYADRCLIFGICAEYNPERFYSMYEEAKKKVSVNAHNKISSSESNNACNW